MNNERAKNNSGPYDGDPPLKIKISKIGLRHVLSWSKLGLEPNFGGFGKRGQTHIQDSCFISIDLLMPEYKSIPTP